MGAPPRTCADLERSPSPGRGPPLAGATSPAPPATRKAASRPRRCLTSRCRLPDRDRSRNPSTGKHPRHSGRPPEGGSCEAFSSRARAGSSTRGIRSDADHPTRAGGASAPTGSCEPSFAYSRTSGRATRGRPESASATSVGPRAETSARVSGSRVTRRTRTGSTWTSITRARTGASGPRTLRARSIAGWPRSSCSGSCGRAHGSSSSASTQG
jgi:hypothetical protein